MSTGFILGKFMPVHRGHMHLIDYAKQRVARLTVLVCSLDREPIPGLLRYRWVADLFPEVDVRHFAEDVPQYPHEHPDFWNIWLGIIRRYVPDGPDYVFTSETYGDRLAAVLGARHVCVDLGRERFPVSGTAVRHDPEKYRGFIPPAVQAYFAGSTADEQR
jgi:HTH-type transcriptional regulator, transcriptional repressor of NAD biosynthesis genes